MRDEILKVQQSYGFLLLINSAEPYTIQCYPSLFAVLAKIAIQVNFIIVAAYVC